MNDVTFDQAENILGLGNNRPRIFDIRANQEIESFNPQSRGLYCFSIALSRCDKYFGQYYLFI